MKYDNLIYKMAFDIQTLTAKQGFLIIVFFITNMKSMLKAMP
jgi:hypothetical protein